MPSTLRALTRMSPPAHKPATYADRLGMGLGSPFDFGHGRLVGWWILDEPELHLAPHILVPDLAGWRRERMPQIPNAAFLELAPDWGCEVLSPSTARLDRGHWRPEASFAEDARVAAPPFEAVTLELDARWIGPAAQG